MFDYLLESVVMSFCLGGIVGGLVALHLANRHATQEDETFMEDGIPVPVKSLSDKKRPR
jgi:hypothetical protein